jgi:hypothetical protein
MLVLLLVQASPVGAAGTRWGSRLNTSISPDNGYQTCDDDPSLPNPTCSYMFRRVHDRDGGQKAPKNGYIDKVRIVSCNAGSFYLQLGKIRSDPNEPGDYQAKVRKTSSKITFDGDSDCIAPYTIEVINIPDVYVYKGEYFGIKTKNPKAIRCGSAPSASTLRFDPALPSGGSYVDADDEKNCVPMIELQYRP